MGLEVEQATGGCCGLAGSWEFEQGKHEISMQCAELGLLPAVRDASAETIVVANGFSCKTQLEAGAADRRALHVAQVMKLARKTGAEGYTPGLPEDGMYEDKPPAPRELKRRRVAVAGVAGAALVAAVAAVARGRSGR